MADTTTTVVRHGWRVRRWRIEVQSGPCQGLRHEVTEGTLRIGSGPAADLRVLDPTVSREHLVAEIEPGAMVVRDLGSKNGTFYQGSRIVELQLPPTGCTLVLGEALVGFYPEDSDEELAPSTATRCGRLVGAHVAMRLLFSQIERVARTRSTVLVHGETGTGKELVAEALHELSPRRDGPFVVVDCSAIPRDLIESELFGHARGAFTGATVDYKGAFERAQGGTLFLDEVGELPLDLQPKLLRVLESRTVRPLGRERTVEVDVRVVAASLRDLALERHERRFRDDLYYRLAVVRLEVPPLRDRLDDLPLLAAEILRQLGAPALDAGSLAVLARGTWPGNVRQLRNVLERAAAFAGDGPLRVREDDLQVADAAPSVLGLPYKEAKELMVARFTAEYLEALLRRHGGNVSAAARESQIDRSWILSLARRHGVKVRD